MKTTILMITVLFLSACADRNVMLDDIPGFWSGIWHGYISTISFVISIFDNDVVIYSRINSGVGYDLGYLIGISGCVTTTTDTIKMFKDAFSYSGGH